jgi:hypothetical protein
VVDGEHVRPAHPLLAAVARKRSSVRERREVHGVIARVVDDEPLRARHLALASTGANEQLASRLAAAAREASARGGRQQAVDLAAHALRRTPVGSAGRGDRVLALAGCLYEAGELRRLLDLLSEELEGLPAGTPRARARLLLGEGEGSRSLDEADGQLELALTECGDDASLRASLLAKRAANAAASGVTRMRDAEAWALEALATADQREVERLALYALAWTRALTGHPVDDLCERSAVQADTSAYLVFCPERVAGQRHIWRGELERATQALGGLLALADERGEEASYFMANLHMCELELRSGDWAAARSRLDELAESSEHELTFRPQYQRCRALLAAGRGDVAGCSSRACSRWRRSSWRRSSRSTRSQRLAP